ncbi:hypothetical protein HJG60_008149 [Phyllostomus discolor]|uniref:Uncharacterized protein n=1 Tax=Phyllostomus discolor TaxID=89673 RepID=A0A833Z1C6_9CHIR|nr:hypothetical protein HJG60_008149 [Phyllostomus discolor]
MGPLRIHLVCGTSQPRDMLSSSWGRKTGHFHTNEAFPSERVSGVVTAPLRLKKSKRQSHGEGPSHARGRHLPQLPFLVAPCSLRHPLTHPFLCIHCPGVGPMLHLRPQAAAGFDLWLKHSLAVQSWVISPLRNCFHIFTCKMGWF